MIYDTIKFLNLEDLVDIIESIDLIKNSNVLSCNLTLKKEMNHVQLVIKTHLLFMAIMLKKLLIVFLIVPLVL